MNVVILLKLGYGRFLYAGLNSRAV